MGRSGLDDIVDTVTKNELLTKVENLKSSDEMLLEENVDGEINFEDLEKEYGEVDKLLL